MRNEVQLIIETGGIVTTSQTFPGVNTAFIDFQNTIDLTQLPFICSPTNFIQVGAVLYVGSATGNSTATVTAYDPNTCTIQLDTPIYWSGSLPLTCEVILDVTSDTIKQDLLDLYEYESISQNWRFTDIQDLTSVGSFSRQFRIPNSPTNAKIFGALSDANYSPEFNYFQRKLKAEIRLNWLPIAKGHIQTLKAYKQLDKITDYELVFFGETPDLVRSLNDKKLAELTDLPNLNAILDYTEVTANTIPKLYALADRGQKWSEGGEPLTRTVVSDSAQVFPADLTPHLQAWYILNQIIEDAGFTTDSPDLQTILEGYFVPWINSRFIQYEEPSQQYLFSAGRTTDIAVTGVQHLIGGMSEFYDYNNNFTPGATSYYTAPVSGYYKFRSFCTIDYVSGVGAAPIHLQLRVGGSTIASSTALFTHSAWWNPSVVPVANTVYINEPVYLTQGDTIYLWVISEASGATYTIKGNVNNNINNGTGFELVELSQSVYGQTIDFAANAPNIKQSDFVKDILKMHNCAIVPDAAIPNRVKIIPMENYLQSGTTEDWTSKLDISKDIILGDTTPYQSRNLTFTYKEGGDVVNKVYKDNGRIYGNYEITGYTTSADQAPNQFANGDLKIELTAQPTPCNYIIGTDIIIPQFINDKGEFTIPGLRFLFNSGEANIKLYNDNTSSIVDTNVPVCNHYSSTNPVVQDFDLNFAPEVPFHTITANPYRNLFNEYWRNYLNGIYSEDARVMEAYFALDLTDLLTFSFSNVYYVKDSYWRVLEINDYKIGELETTKVTLLKIIDPKPDCSLVPDVNDAGQIDWIDQQGNPASPTQQCCNRYGYFWSESLGLCLSLGGGTPTDTNGGGAPSMMTAIGSTINTKSLNAVVGSNISQDGYFGAFAGSDIQIESGNSYSSAFGDTLKLKANATQSNLFGRNALAKSGGLHVGAGWLGNDRSGSAGSAQFGIIGLGAKDSYVSSGNNIELLVDNLPNTRLNLEDNSSWACTLMVNMSKDNISNYGYALFSFMIWKSGTAAASAVNTIYTLNNFTTFTIGLTIDTATNTAEHRLKITATGTGFPHNNIRLVGQLNYTQFTT